MPVDDALYRRAVELLERRFPDEPGMATAAYTSSGRTLTGVRVDAVMDPACLCPETGPICEAARDQDPITALITVARSTPGGRVVVLKPCGICMERLVYQAVATAEIAVHDRYGPRGFQVRTFQELIHPHPGIPCIDDAHRLGMRELAGPLRALAGDAGVQLVEERYAALFRAALQDPAGRAEYDQRSAQAPSAYSRWTTLATRALRQLGWAFDRATTDITDLFVETHAAQLRELGCDAHDLTHVKAGSLGFVNIFSSLLVFLETGARADYELPFEPYDPALLTHGRPLHEAVARPAGALSPRALVDALATALGERGPGGFTHYARQRRLYSIKLFSEGTRSCPFASFSEAICFTLADVIPAAVDDGLVRLE